MKGILRGKVELLELWHIEIYAKNVYASLEVTFVQGYLSKTDFFNEKFYQS